jgi:hypothetical protein
VTRERSERGSERSEDERAASEGPSEARTNEPRARVRANATANERAASEGPSEARTNERDWSERSHRRTSRVRARRRTSEIGPSATARRASERKRAKVRKRGRRLLDYSSTVAMSFGKLGVRPSSALVRARISVFSKGL